MQLFFWMITLIVKSITCLATYFLSVYLENISLRKVKGDLTPNNPFEKGKEQKILLVYRITTELRVFDWFKASLEFANEMEEK